MCTLIADTRTLLRQLGQLNKEKEPSNGTEIPQIRRNWAAGETCNKLYIIADAKTTVIIINVTVTHAIKLDRGRETGTSE